MRVDAISSVPPIVLICKRSPDATHREEIVHQLDWQCAELLGNWEELVLLMGHVTRQCETISD